MKVFLWGKVKHEGFNLGQDKTKILAWGKVNHEDFVLGQGKT